MDTSKDTVGTIYTNHEYGESYVLISQDPQVFGYIGSGPIDNGSKRLPAGCTVVWRPEQAKAEQDLKKAARKAAIDFLRVHNFESAVLRNIGLVSSVVYGSEADRRARLAKVLDAELDAIAQDYAKEQGETETQGESGIEDSTSKESSDSSESEPVEPKLSYAERGVLAVAIFTTRDYTTVKEIKDFLSADSGVVFMPNQGHWGSVSEKNGDRKKLLDRDSLLLMADFEDRREFLWVEDDDLLNVFSVLQSEDIPVYSAEQRRTHEEHREATREHWETRENSAK